MKEIEAMAKQLNMRIGQFILNTLDYHNLKHTTAYSLFYLEDNKLLEMCKDYVKSLKVRS